MTDIYKVGKEVWVARIHWNGEHILCPVCFGNKGVKVILGNGNTEYVSCSICTVGFNPPSGTIKDFRYVARPEKMVITKVVAISNENGKVYEYRSGYCTLEPNDIFLCKEEAEEKCKELIREAENEEINRMIHRKEKGKSDMVYSIGYHRKEITKLKKQITIHEKCIQLRKDVI